MQVRWTGKVISVKQGMHEIEDDRGRKYLYNPDLVEIEGE